jgi:multicomponent Na+:H+ antiporter subunit C
MSSAVLVGVLVAGGVWLVLQRDLLRAALGFVLVSHAVNVLLLAAGGTDRRAPALVGDGVPADSADPLPQAFTLTAIVISFGITVVLVALSGREAVGTGDDDDGHDAGHDAGDARGDVPGDPAAEGGTG